MNKKILFFLFILLLIPVYSDTYTEYTSNGTISCSTSSPSCFLKLYNYNADNSHVALCNNTAPIQYGCQIISSTTISSQTVNYFIPINFTWTNCQNPILYLYNERNSHVSLYPKSYSVCFDQYFSKVLNISNTSGSFLIGLYNTNNSHVSTSQRSYNLFINVTDKVFPNVSYNDTRDYLTVPVYINVTFYDNLYLYYCNIYINNKLIDLSNSCKYSSSYNYTFNITSSDCPPGNPCTITYVTVDLAGNLYKRVKSYTVLNPCLNLVLGGSISSLILVGFDPYFLRIRLENPLTCIGNFTNITLTVDGTDCTGIILVNGGNKASYSISKLANGGSWETTVRIDPLRTGNCNLRIIANGTVENLNENRVYMVVIPVSVAIRTALGFLIVSEPTIILAIILIVISFLLL